MKEPTNDIENACKTTTGSKSELIEPLGTEVAVLVEWLDSASNPGWQGKDECKVDVTKCQTIGFMVAENDDGICLALNKTITPGYKPFGELMSIPKAAILNTYSVMVR